MRALPLGRCAMKALQPDIDRYQLLCGTLLCSVLLWGGLQSDTCAQSERSAGCNNKWRRDLFSAK